MSALYRSAIPILVVVLLIPACGKESPQSPTVGTITIAPTPNVAPWSITGPGGFQDSGEGARDLENRESGTYTITWKTLTGWDLPDPAVDQQTLARGGSLTFAGVYTARPGTITIEPTPGTASWSITGPGGFSDSGAGYQDFPDSEPGTYTVTWDALLGWDRPVPAVDEQNLAAGGSLRFAGTYIQQGMIRIRPKPAGLDVSWQLVGPGGFQEGGSGQADRPYRSSGVYTLTWQVWTGWERPDPAVETKTLVSGGEVVFEGVYVENDFVLILPGTFTMGSPTTEPGRSSGETPHQVTLTRGFYMSKYEVTEQWWAEVMNAPSTNSQFPKRYVSWDMAVEFCNELSDLEGLTPAYTIHGPNGDVTWHQDANGYRLPTEAEWEYACRAGSTTAFANGPITDVTCDCSNLDVMGWYCGNRTYAEGPAEVHQKQANQWGLYDMHGNLWEWVWDGYRWDYENLPSVNPVHNVGPISLRVLRGGGWYALAQYCRSAARDYYYPYYEDYSGGFRPVRSAF